MRAIHHNADSNDNPTSKDEGYSTMPSNVKVDSSSSSSSSFIASGCSSPATLRRSASGRSTAVPSTTRSLPMVKDVAQFVAGRAAESRPQPNRSISLQETHSGAGLEELKKEPMKKRHLALILWTTAPRPFSTTTKKIRLFRPSVPLFVLF